MNDETRRNLRIIESDFQRAVSKFFGVPIRIEERALNAVCVWRGSNASSSEHPLPLHVWAQIEREIPLIQQLYQSLAIGPPRHERMGLPNVEYRAIDDRTYDSKRFNWDETLHSIFGNPASNHFSLAGSRIRESRLLSARDLVSGLLELTDEQIRASATPRINLKRSLLAQLAYRHPECRIGSGWITEFSRRAIEQWDNVCELDPYFGNQQFIIVDSPTGFRVLPFSVLGGYNIIEKDERRIWHARGNVLEPVSDDTQEQIDELEKLINHSGAERDFQRFFERYPRFLTNIGPYQRVHSQLVLHRQDEGHLIPDFFLEKIDSDFCDICDLKLPSSEIVRHQKNRTRFRDAIMEGVAQLRHYREWFDVKDNSASFSKKYSLNSYRPRAILVIGRKASFTSEIQRLHLESELPQWFQLLTYDEILSRAKYWQREKQQWIQNA